MLGERILSCECDEPDGKKMRHVYKMPLDMENLKKFWETSRDLQTIFSKETRGNFHAFVELLMTGEGADVYPNGLFFVVDDFAGIFYMTRIVPGVDALLHYVFFDRRHKGRAQLVKEMLKWAFVHYSFKRLSAELPAYVSANTKDFVDRQLGFTREGRKRKAVEYKGTMFDLNLYGILREEAFGDMKLES